MTTTHPTAVSKDDPVVKYLDKDSLSFFNDSTVKLSELFTEKLHELALCKKRIAELESEIVDFKPVKIMQSFEAKLKEKQNTIDVLEKRIAFLLKKPSPTPGAVASLITPSESSAESQKTHDMEDKKSNKQTVEQQGQISDTLTTSVAECSEPLFLSAPSQPANEPAPVPPSKRVARTSKSAGGATLPTECITTDPNTPSNTTTAKKARTKRKNTTETSNLITCMVEESSKQTAVPIVKRTRGKKTTVGPVSNSKTCSDSEKSTPEDGFDSYKKKALDNEPVKDTVCLQGDIDCVITTDSNICLTDNVVSILSNSSNTLGVDATMDIEKENDIHSVATVELIQSISGDNRKFVEIVESKDASEIVESKDASDHVPAEQKGLHSEQLDPQVTEMQPPQTEAKEPESMQVQPPQTEAKEPESMQTLPSDLKSEDTNQITEKCKEQQKPVSGAIVTEKAEAVKAYFPIGEKIDITKYRIISLKSVSGKIIDYYMNNKDMMVYKKVSEGVIGKSIGHISEFCKVDSNGHLLLNN